MIQAAKLQIEVDAETRDAQRGIEAVNDKLNSATRSMSRVGLGMSAAVTAPLLGIATAALQSAGGFEQSMNILQQVVGATAGDMASLQEEALRLGAVTSFSAGEAAEAMLELGKAGMDTEEIMASIGGVMDLAAAGGVSLAEAANLTAAALNAFGLEASESGRIANMLAAAANASAADVSDLGAGLRQAGFAFSLANQPIENLVASLAILSNVGLTGSDAGTALKNAFMRMINPTAEAASLMKELGISFYDASGAMRQLPEIIDILNGALSGLTPQQRDAALATIFLSDGMKAMIPLLDQGSAGFNAMVGEVTQAGAASEVADARMRGLTGGIEYLKGSIDSFLIGAALPFTEMLGNLARGAGDALTAFGDLPAPVLSAALSFAGVLAAAGPLMLALAGITAALSFLISPIGLVITATAALAAAWAADIGGIQAITAATFSSVQSWFASTAASAQALGTSIGAAFSKTEFPSLQALWEQFKAGDFQRIADTIRNTAFDLMVNLDAELNITAQANQLKQQLIGVVQGLGTAIGSQVRDFKDALSNFEITLPTFDLSEASQGWADSMNELANTINNQDWTPFGRNIVRGILGALNAVLTADVSGMESFANKLAFSVRSSLKSIQWGDLNQSFSALAVAVRGGIYEVFSGMGEELGPHVAAANLSFSAHMEKLGAEIRSGVGTAFDGANEEFSSKMSTLGTDIRLGIAGAFFGMDTEFTAVMTTLGANMRTGITTGLTGIDTAFSTQMETVGADIRTSIGTFFGDINTEFSNKLTTLGADIRSYIANAFAGLFGGLSSAQGSTVGGNIGIGSGDSPSLIEDEGRIGKAKYKTIPQPWLAGSAAGTAGSARQEPLDWTQFVTPLLWETYVLPLDWATIVTALDWGMYLMSLAWDNFVTQLAWANYITRVSWDTYVPRLNWGSYVSNLNWDSYIGDMSWGNYVDRLDWARFVPRLAASAIGGGGGASTASVSMARASTAGMVGVAGMATAAGGGINVYIDKVSSDMDIEVIVNRVVRKIQQRVG